MASIGNTIVFAAPSTGVYRNSAGKPAMDTVLFSFEGMNPIASSTQVD
jgi:hypothetical protein